MEEKQKKKFYQKWWFWVLAVIVAIIAWNKIGNAIENFGVKEIPNVFGLNYSEATVVLEESGFKVTSIETDAENILKNSISYDRSVKKGEVFKINDEVDPNPYQFTTKNKKITIYYAEADYTYVEPVKESKPEVQEQPAVQAEDNIAAESTASTVAWREFLDEYEAWVDRYVAFYKKYQANPTDLTLLADYATMTSELTEWSTKTEEMEQELESASAAELAEYTAELARIAAKLAQIAY